MTLNIIHLPHGEGYPPHRQQRYDTLMKELASQNITDYWIWAGIENKYPVCGVSRAFKRIVQYAKDNNLERVCIGEDDLKFTAPGAWKYFLDNIPSYFDMYMASFYSGVITFDNRVEKFRGMTLIVVHNKFYDKFLSSKEYFNEDKDNPQPPDEVAYINIDNALDGLGEYFVSPLWPCIQHPGFSDKDQRMVNYDDRIPQHKLFKGE